MDAFFGNILSENLVSVRDLGSNALIGGFDPACQPEHVAKLAKSGETQMRTLNCRPGDLAVTIKAALSENLGRIVRVVSYHGRADWWGFDRPTDLWEIEALEGSYLVYELEDGTKEYRLRGLAPDTFLKPIVPFELQAKEGVDHALL